VANKPFGADQLNLRLRKFTGQTTVSSGAPVGELENLTGNFEFHVGHFKPNVESLQ
jgi:hypothetical protein